MQDYILSIRDEYSFHRVIFELKRAAMQNCEVTWKMPFVSKYGQLLPLVAELTVKFIEIQPLYKQTLEHQFDKRGGHGL